MNDSLQHSNQRWRWVSISLLLAAMGLGLWNAWTIPPLQGFDAAGHAGYICTIAEKGRLPEPLEGWSTFHPPLYYLVGAVVWKASSSTSGMVLQFLLRMISLVAYLAIGLSSYRIVRSMTGEFHACITLSVVLFLPSLLMSSVMIGNEVLGVALSSAALIPILQLQEDNTHSRSALVTGLLVGLALMTKYSGVWILVASVVPFLRRGLSRHSFRSLRTLMLAVAIVAGPVYLRNFASSGTALPMTRTLDPMKSVEAALELRPREVTDYLWINPQCLVNPSIYIPTEDEDNLNRAMGNVWGLVHASTWSDAFGHRIPTWTFKHVSPPLILLAILGLVPTAVALMGLGITLIRLKRQGMEFREAPLAMMAIAGLASFVYFTAQAPSIAAAKGTYLLPLITPFAVFFAVGLERLGKWLRVVSLSATISAVCMSAVLFIQGLVYPAIAQEDVLRMLSLWMRIGKALPDSSIVEAIVRITS